MPASLKELKSQFPRFGKPRSMECLLLRQLAFESARERRDIFGTLLVGANLSTLWGYTTGKSSCEANASLYIRCLEGFRTLGERGILRVETPLHSRTYSFPAESEGLRRDLLGLSPPPYHPEYWKPGDGINDSHCPRCREHLFAVPRKRSFFRCPQDGTQWECSPVDCPDCDAPAMGGEWDVVAEGGRKVKRRVFVCTKCGHEFFKIPDPLA